MSDELRRFYIAVQKEVSAPLLAYIATLEAEIERLKAEQPAEGHGKE